ncbi:27 kDa antigen Cfp30B [Streptomyces sp. ADI96-02]|uniref:VOC family protein n=1 Tax=Streptomyces sp. ADI96-02 TaxID=1522760 RepID=UPI000F5534A1|nr:VOC family protein [Streptomyces sp. ADI96-02]RPK60630.1 27 kDa antigen Cfp30B [Streptomyces sp. ADI96-02]
MAAFAHSAPCWVDVQLSDLEAGKRFYGGLFGWSFRADDGMPFADALSEGRLVAGLAAKKDGRLPTAWGVSFATDDVRATVAAIREHGGQVITDPVRAGRAAITAQAADPGGAVFGLWQPVDRAGFEKQNEPGSFCWTEVYTRQPERVDPFYEQVFGFRSTDPEHPDDPGGADHPDGAGGAGEGVPGRSATPVGFRMWSPRGTEPGPDTAVGGRSVITDALPAVMPSHFLTYFAVGDCDAAAELAVRLGGRISAEPFDIPYGRMAVLHDDQGAVFAVLQPGRSLR